MEQSPPTVESEPPAPKEPPTSLAARLLNVFATPGEVFEEVKAAKSSTANWLVPVLIASVVGALSAIILFSQPAILQQLREKQERTLDKQVQAGKMTRAQAEQALAMVEKFSGPAMMKLFGSIGAVFYSFGRVFWWALVLWLLGRWFLNVRFDYMKAVEVAGLASMIAVLGMLVATLLAVNLGKLFSSPSLALAISDFDPQKKSHLLLGALNVFYFWQVGVMSVALARLAAVPFARAMLGVLGVWVFWELLLIYSGLGTMAL